MLWNTKGKKIDIDIILFNDGDVGLLHPRSDTFTVRRRMNMVLDDYDGKIIPGAKCRLNFLTFVLELRKDPRKNLNQEIDPMLVRTWARWVIGSDVIRDQNGSFTLILLFLFFYPNL